MYVIGIDPGLTSGGIIAWNGERILASHTYTWTPSKRKEIISARDHEIGDLPFTDAVLISNAQSARMINDIKTIIKENGKPACIGIESFVDQRHRAREEKGYLIKERWKTPLLIGALLGPLEELGYSIENNNLLWQNAGTVLRQKSDLIKQAKSKDWEGLKEYISNPELLSNDHLQKAWAHADWTYVRILRNSL